MKSFSLTSTELNIRQKLGGYKNYNEKNYVINKEEGELYIYTLPKYFDRDTDMKKVSLE